MTRINLRVPDDVYADLIRSAEESHQSPNAFIVDRLADVARCIKGG
jgi:hypothetical protein